MPSGHGSPANNVGESEAPQVERSFASQGQNKRTRENTDRSEPIERILGNKNLH